MGRFHGSGAYSRRSRESSSRIGAVMYQFVCQASDATAGCLADALFGLGRSGSSSRLGSSFEYLGTTGGCVMKRKGVTPP